MCVACGDPFPFTAAEQEFFRSRGFDHDPKRCPACRRKRRGRRRGESRPAEGSAQRRVEVRHVGGGSDASGGPRGKSGPRPRYDAVCSKCGAATTVPFVPDGVRPIFCLACLKQTTR